MKAVRGFYLPDHEEHLIPFLDRGPMFEGGPTYQFQKLTAAMDYVKRKHRAVDVGGHCGLWSRVLSHWFDEVIAFEPVVEHRECFEKNLIGRSNWALYPCALGDRDMPVSLHTGPNSSGDTYIKAGGEHSAQMARLDNFEIEAVDFLKIDCEGFEKYVLLGGEQTIRKSKPCIIVEQKPGKAKQFGFEDTEAVTLLKSWGAVQRKVISGDFIMSWN